MRISDWSSNVCSSDPAEKIILIVDRGIGHQPVRIDQSGDIVIMPGHILRPGRLIEYRRLAMGMILQQRTDVRSHGMGRTIKRAVGVVDRHIPMTLNYRLKH